MHKTNPSIKAWFELNRYYVILVLLTTCMLVALELKHPFFFLGPDNLHQNLPYYVHNYRALLSGEFPLFNFHQYLGTPVLACVQSAAFYLPNYLAVFLSRLFFGHYYATMEFIAAFHLIIASLGFYKLMRQFDLEQWSCCFGALAWSFCCFVIVNGNATIMMVGYAAYFPLLLLYSLRQINAFNLRDYILLTLLRIVIIFIGYPPYIIYIYTFELLTVTALYFITANYSNGINGGFTQSSAPSFFIFLIKQASSYLCTFIIAAPLLLPALHQISLSAHRKVPFTWEQYSENSYGINDWLSGLLTPIPVPHDIYTGYGMQFLSHIGWLTIAMALLSLILLRQRSAHRKIYLVFLALAVFSFLWANDTFITKLFYYVPYFNRQRWPFKLAYFTSFFMIVIASFGFDYWFGKIKKYEGAYKRITAAIIPLLLVIHVAGYLGVYLTFPQINMEIRRTRLPVFDEPLTDSLKSGRIVSIVSSHSAEDLLAKYGENYANTLLLGFNYATLFNLYHFAGYEVLISDNNLKHALMLNNSAYLFSENHFAPAEEDLVYFRNWGVKWYVVAKDVPIASPHLLKVFSTDAYRTVMYDSGAKPFVSWLADNSEHGISYRFTTNSIIVTTVRENSGQLLVNVLYNPFFKATVDGRKTGISESSDSQMIVSVPSGRHEVKFTFIDPYFYTGIYTSVGFLALISGGYLLRRYKRMHQADITA